ncbi:hypothetical protein FHT39_000347 [Mitsuaria sp. BK045]|uniref:hypothetical protein n=1 Tax=unclassified Roseateles TaxID=2626991 RepID=UPI0016203C95|nr:MULTISPECIES: hypothetical protein [unclassified Roseateles]MBB3291708.1 hypothetical protein [Mitsuaria sp. BK041]MBB3360925.1 hypothetical protein [Mitsuaria sp. BK045]
MFNLLVSADETAWEGRPSIFDLTRCIREYTDADITKRFGDLDEASVEQLKKLPAIFAYEEAVGKAPKFGRITDVSKRANRREVRVDYELIPLQRFLTSEELWSMGAELDYGTWESSRTHWAVKNVDLMRELLAKGIILPPQFAAAGQPRIPSPLQYVDITQHHFDVAFSFPGEYRETVEAVARETTVLKGSHSRFYDNNYQAQLARPGLDLLLQALYRDRAKLIVVFIGSDYQRKVWPGIEWTAIRSIITNLREPARVMYVKMDEGQVDGIFHHDGYIDGRKFSAAQIAEFIAERLHFLGPRQAV